MPLPFSQEQSYTKINRIFVDSEERESGTISDYQYLLKDEIQQVVGIELTAYAIPTTLTPTFIPNLNDQFKFELTHAGLGHTFVATVTFPSKSYTYENVENPYLSYVIAMKQFMNESIFNDPVFGNAGTNPVTFLVFADPETRTHVSAVGTGLTGFRFLFQDIQNSANVAMGFDNTNTANNLTQISPRKVSLDPFPRLDIFVKEFPELSPLDAIYNPNASYYGTTRNDSNVTRTRLLSSKPVRKLTCLTISLRIDGIPVVDKFENEHSLCFTIISIANEEKVPNWAKLQQLTL
jgi:hypothetical protein